VKRRASRRVARARREPATPAEDSFERELLASIEAVHRFALRLTRDGPAAEDLVQETYLRALAHREQYAPGTNCRAWLFTICRNAFVRGAMRDQREVAVEDAELHDAVLLQQDLLAYAVDTGLIPPRAKSKP
jgi:RNA polymerase sigma-70 factor (ECF subfamily)